MDGEKGLRWAKKGRKIGSKMNIKQPTKLIASLSLAHSHPSSIPWTPRCPNEFRPILDVKKSSHGLPINDGLKPSATYVPWLSIFGSFRRLSNFLSLKKLDLFHIFISYSSCDEESIHQRIFFMLNGTSVIECQSFALFTNFFEFFSFNKQFAREVGRI